MGIGGEDGTGDEREGGDGGYGDGVGVGIMDEGLGGIGGIRCPGPVRTHPGGVGSFIWVRSRS